jgi:hypothetical protein
LGDLHKLVGQLIERYPWEEFEAVWFVLTGRAPWVAPLSWQARGSGVVWSFEHQFITIKVEPWVSEETLQRTYREAQLQLLQGDNRPAKDKQVKLLRFVTSRTDPTTLTPNKRARMAKELLAKWDEQNPDDAYGRDTRRFWRDYDRSLRLIAQPISAAKERQRQKELRKQRRRGI